VGLYVVDNQQLDQGTIRQLLRGQDSEKKRGKEGSISRGPGVHAASCNFQGPQLDAAQA
jgi:hypothetical protein